MKLKEELVPHIVVLAVDDEPQILSFLRISLTHAGYDVITAGGGEEALQLVTLHKPDVMLLDICMVPVSGFDVLVRLREFSQMPVVVFTARREIGEVALREGANDYLAKPFVPSELVKKIQSALNDQLKNQPFNS